MTLDTLAASQASIVQIGEVDAFRAIDAALAAHNRIMLDMLAPLVERTTDRRRRYGGADQMMMDVLDEFGRADAQKVAAGSDVDFPLQLFGGSIQWTRQFFQNATGAELAAQVTAMMTADTRRFILEIKKALFNPTNATVLDRLVDNTGLNIKRLVNADSAPIPLGPNGETFDAATHTHYLGTAAFVAANLTSLIDTVVEHQSIGQVMVYINAAQEAAVRGFVGFTAYTDARLINQTAGVIANRSLDMVNVNNRAIGVFGAAEVWVKTWQPSGYVLALVEGATPPLVYRTRNGGGNLELVADDEAHPLRARSWEREYGIGVWGRTSAAALRTNNAVYAMPTLTA